MVRIETSQENLVRSAEYLKYDVENIKKDLKNIKQNMSTKTDLMDLGVKIDGIRQYQKRLIEELEEEASITNPHKN